MASTFSLSTTDLLNIGNTANDINTWYQDKVARKSTTQDQLNIVQDLTQFLNNPFLNEL